MIKRRTITPHLKKMLKLFPILTLTGPRQSGKTTLLTHEFPNYKYFNLERHDYRQVILRDPIGFLKQEGSRVIFDEAQNLPELFSYIQVISDERNTAGQYILSGSQSFLLNEKISQSLAGRVSINHLLPYDITELPETNVKNYTRNILNGFYPRIHEQKISGGDFHPSYLQTYIERDIRTLRSIENLNLFSRFLSLCAGRVGQILNLTSLANDAGITINTVKSWLSLLESSFVIFLLQPYYKNISKRVIKSPKLYFYDTGVVSSLLRLTDESAVKNNFLYGALFENLVVAEILKYSYHIGKQPSIFYLRESNGTEVDLVVEKKFDEVALIEIKAGETFNADFIKNLRLAASINKKIKVKSFLIHPTDRKTKIDSIEILPWHELKNLMKKLI